MRMTARSLISSISLISSLSKEKRGRSLFFVLPNHTPGSVVTGLAADADDHLSGTAVARRLERRGDRRDGTIADSDHPNPPCIT